MITTNIRKQGGAAIITIPSDVLRILNIKIGSTLELEVTNEGISLHPTTTQSPQRYTLDQLLEGVTPRTLNALNKETAWAREGKPVGRELL